MDISRSSPNSDTIVVGDKIYIPAARVSAAKVRRGFERRLFDERKCKSCDVYKEGERFSESLCGPCPAHKGMFRTWDRTRVRGIDYIAVPSGNPGYVSKQLDIDFSKFKILDIRATVKAKARLKFTKSLYRGQVVNSVPTVDQVGLLKRYWIKKRGLILARARSGKTVIGARLHVAFGMRMLVIAHEMELLNQFYDTFINFTNIRAAEKHYGHPLIGIITKPSDLTKSLQWDVVLTTYQRFISDEKGLMYINKFLRGKFGVVIVDEVHRGNAESYQRVLNKLDPKFKVGLTATRERKDGLEFLIDQIIGPVNAEAESIGLTPQVTLHETKFEMDYEPQGMTAYTKITRAMADDTARNIQIVRQVFADLRANPKNNIVIPVLFVEHCHRLSNLINNYAAHLRDKGEDWPINLAMPYHARTNKKVILAAARSAEETRVTVAIRSKVAEGIDVPAWNIMYMQFPINNFANFYQISQRILTPAPDKPQPHLRFFVDRIGLSLGCLNATWWNGVVKYKYAYSGATKAQFDMLVSLNSKKGKRGKKSTQQKIGRSL